MGPALGGGSRGLASIYSEALQEGEAEDTMPTVSYSRLTSSDSTYSSGSLKKQFTSFTSSSHIDASVLTFYTSLIRLLACCATSPASPMDKLPGGKQCGGNLPAYDVTDPNESYSANRQKLSMISRTRSILQNLIKAEDVVAILSFKSFDGRDPGLSPSHKEAALLFFSRVYGIPGPDVLLQLLNNAFLPDIKLALSLSKVKILCHHFLFSHLTSRFSSSLPVSLLISCFMFPRKAACLTFQLHCPGTSDAPSSHCLAAMPPSSSS